MSAYTFQARQHTLFLDIIYFLEERGKVDHNTVSNQACTSRIDETWMTFLISEKKKKKTEESKAKMIERTTRNQVKRKGFLHPIDVHDDGMPSVITTSATSTHINVRGEYIHQLPLALVTPLRSEHNRDCMK